MFNGNAGCFGPAKLGLLPDRNVLTKAQWKLKNCGGNKQDMQHNLWQVNTPSNSQKAGFSVRSERRVIMHTNTNSYFLLWLSHWQMLIWHFIFLIFYLQFRFYRYCHQIPSKKNRSFVGLSERLTNPERVKDWEYGMNKVEHSLFHIMHHLTFSAAFPTPTPQTPVPTWESNDNVKNIIGFERKLKQYMTETENGQRNTSG